MESGRARFSSLLPAGAAGEVRRKHRVNNHLSNSSFSVEAAVPEEETAGFPRVESTVAISVHRRSASTSKLKMTTRKPSATSPSVKQPMILKTVRSKATGLHSKREPLPL